MPTKRPITKGDRIVVKRIVYKGLERRGCLERRITQTASPKERLANYFGRRRKSFRPLRKSDKQKLGIGLHCEHLRKWANESITGVAKDEGITTKQARQLYVENSPDHFRNLIPIGKDKKKFIVLKINLKTNRFEWASTRRLFPDERRRTALIDLENE